MRSLSLPVAVRPPWPPAILLLAWAGAAWAAEPAVELRDVDLAGTFVNAAHLEKTAEGVIPLRCTRASLDSLGDAMRPIARMGTGIELQIQGTIRAVEVTARCRFDDGCGVTAEWFRGPPHRSCGSRSRAYSLRRWPPAGRRWPTWPAGLRRTTRT